MKVPGAPEPGATLPQSDALQDTLHVTPLPESSPVTIAVTGSVPVASIELALADSRGTWRTLFASLTPDRRERIAATLARIGLTADSRKPAGALSHGQKQWLEIGMLLIHDRQLLLLDEPVAGMTDRETEETAAMILDLARDRTIVVVEHDMAFVRSLGARVTVLHEGSVLAEGSVEHVQNHPRVIEVYLGR